MKFWSNLKTFRADTGRSREGARIEMAICGIKFLLIFGRSREGARIEIFIHIGGGAGGQQSLPRGSED